MCLEGLSIGHLIFLNWDKDLICQEDMSLFPLLRESLSLIRFSQMQKCIHCSDVLYEGAWKLVLLSSMSSS